jgi:hypothetical protein
MTNLGVPIKHDRIVLSATRLAKDVVRVFRLRRRWEILDGNPFILILLNLSHVVHRLHEFLMLLFPLRILLGLIVLLDHFLLLFLDLLHSLANILMPLDPFHIEKPPTFATGLSDHFLLLILVLKLNLIKLLDNLSFLLNPLRQRIKWLLLSADLLMPHIGLLVETPLTVNTLLKRPFIILLEGIPI